MRHEFPNSVKRDAAARAAGHCEAVWDGERCNAKLPSGGFHYDHVLPDWLDGEPTLENCEVLCIVCHKIKTKADIARIAKTKRLRDRDQGIKRSGRKIPGSRGTGIRKPVNGLAYRVAE